LFGSNRLQLRIYDTSEHLVLLVNATAEEEKGFAEELGMRIKVVGFELPAATRYALIRLYPPCSAVRELIIPTP
jgi:hypothetical protein